MASSTASASVATECLRRLRALAPQYDARLRQFVHRESGAPLSGLVRCLENRFYAPTVHGARRYGGTSSSTARGIEMDAQIEEWVRDGVTPHGTFAKTVIRALQRASIKLLATQVPITDTELGIYAVADGLGVDAAGRMVVLEWKSGYDVAYTTGRGKMAAPLGDIPNSYRHRHALQVYVACLMLKKQLDIDAGRVRSLVVVTNKSGTRVWQVDKRMCVADTDILCALKSEACSGH